MDEEKVVNLYKSGLYAVGPRVHNMYDSILMTSCYYPPLLMWIHNLGPRFSDKLKVIISEDFYQFRRVYVVDRMQWVSGGSLSEQSQSDLINFQSKVEKIGSNSPDDEYGKMGDHLFIYEPLSSFYADCNAKLYEVVESQPTLLLKDAAFPRWD